MGKRSSKPQGYKGLPPYAPHSSWRELMDGFRLDLPARVDGSYLRRYQFTPSTQSMLQGALRFLGLLDNEMAPTTALKDLAMSQGEVYRSGLREMVERSYAPVLGDTDLTTVTPDMLKKMFKGAGARADVARKCLSFFAAIAGEAGIPISPYVRSRHRQRTSQGPVKRSTRAKSASKAPPAIAKESPRQQGGTESAGPSALALVLDKFPAFDPSWDPDTAARWRESISYLVTSLRREKVEAEDGTAGSS